VRNLQGLFERHKLVVATQLTMAILGKEGKLVDGRFELLISRERRAPQASPMPDWLPDAIWTAANALKVPSPRNLLLIRGGELGQRALRGYAMKADSGREGKGWGGGWGVRVNSAFGEELTI